LRRGGFGKTGVGCWGVFWKVIGGGREVVECRVMKRRGGGGVSKDIRSTEIAAFFVGARARRCLEFFLFVRGERELRER